MKTEKQPEGHKVPVQPDASTAGNNRETELIGKDEVIAQVLDYVNPFNLRFHNGQEWVEPTKEIIDKCLTDFENGNELTMILRDNKPAVFQITFVEYGGVNFEVSVPIESVEEAVESALSVFDFQQLSAELQKYGRSFLKEDGSLCTDHEYMVAIARDGLIQLLTSEHLNSRALFCLLPMVENGREISGGFVPIREFEGPRLMFSYVGASGDDVPEEARQ